MPFETQLWFPCQLAFKNNCVRKYQNKDVVRCELTGAEIRTYCFEDMREFDGMMFDVCHLKCPYFKILNSLYENHPIVQN